MGGGVVIELVSLKLKAGVEESDFLRAAEDVTVFLSQCAGFIRRRLAKSDGEDWIDYVEWRTLPDALSAAKRFNQVPDTQQFNAAIEPGSVVMRHLTVHSAVN